MQVFACIAGLLLTSAMACATPVAQPGKGPGGSGPNGGGPGPACLNSTGVNTLVNGYTYLLEKPGGPNFNATADAILSATNFTVQSDSILTLSGRPLGQLAYPSKQVYVDTQNQTPPLPSVNTLGVFATCNQISWRWVATGVGSDEYEIRGIIVFDVDPVSVKIQAVYSEFNTAAFEKDLGA